MRDESFQAWTEEQANAGSLLGTKKCFVLLCPIDEQHLLSSFREFVHDRYWIDHGLSKTKTYLPKTYDSQANFQWKNNKISLLILHFETTMENVSRLP